MKQQDSRFRRITVISLLLGVIWLSPAWAADAPTFAAQGQITAGLSVPGAMDLDGSGNLYVADASSGMVNKYSSYGGLLQSFNLSASGRGLAVAPNGSRLYVARQNTVVIADSNSGATLGTLSGGPVLAMAGAIDLDAFGNVFVVDSGNMQVNIYGASGQYKGSFGGVGSAAGQFMQIGAMAINSLGQVVVADTSAKNGMIHVFNLDANLIASLAASYSGANAASFGSPSMYAPRGLTFDGQGRGFLLEFMSSQVRVFSESFSYLGSYAQAGYGAGQLNNVTDAIFDAAHGRLFVGCDTGRIVILGVDGGQVVVPVNSPPSDPVQKSPVAGSEVASATPALVINNATDAEGDAVTYSVTVTQNDVVVFEIDDVPAELGETTTVVVDVELAENAAFVWTVQASDGQAQSAEATASFVVNAVEDAPTTPELSAPLNGEAIAGEDLLSWLASTDPDPNDSNISYLVEVALDEEFSQLVAEESLVGTSLSLASFAAYNDLLAGSGYFWRVTAQDATQAMSAPSAAGQFVYETTVLNISANMPDSLISFSGNHAYAGEVVGFAPVELRDFAPGTLSVVVERAGFEPFVAQVSLALGDTVDLYATLLPAMAVKDLKVSNKGINGDSLSVSDAAVPFVVDYDSDGDLDMLVGDGSGQVTLFANLRMAGPNKLDFDNGVTLGLPVMPGAVPFVADWNNDRRKDLIVGQADGSVKVFINVGQEEAPAFASGVDAQTTNGALSVGSNAAPVVVDYNGDGAKDLLVGNGSGEVLVFLNQATDAAPLFASPYTAMQVEGAVVPFSVDWNADGQDELMVTAGGVVSVYANAGGAYQLVEEYSDKKVEFSGAFPIDIDGSGKKLLAGQSDGLLVYLTSNGNDYADSFQLALQAKVDELGEYVAEENPALLADVSALGAQIEAGDYDSVALSANRIALNLAAGAAQVSAIELANLCQ